MAYPDQPFRPATQLERPDGMSPVTTMLLMTAPAVLVAAALRPRSRSASRSSSD